MQNTYLSNKNPTKIIDSSLNVCKHLIEINIIKHATKNNQNINQFSNTSS